MNLINYGGGLNNLDLGSLRPYFSPHVERYVYEQKKPLGEQLRELKERVLKRVRQTHYSLAAASGLSSSYAFALLVEPYSLTLSTLPYATLTPLIGFGVGALIGGVLGLILYFGWLRGYRKKDPRFAKEPIQSFVKWLLDYIEEMMERAKRKG